MSTSPYKEWVTQQARNFSMTLDDEAQKMALLIKDGDLRYTESFDDVFRWKGTQVKRLPYKSPNLNPFAESWVGMLKRECLNRFIFFGESHFRRVLDEYVEFYNRYRPHGALGSTITPLPMPHEGEIRCEEKLGGLLKHYYRKAA